MKACGPGWKFVRSNSRKAANTNVSAVSASCSHPFTLFFADECKVAVCQQDVVHFVDPRSVVSCQQLATTASQQQLAAWAKTVDALDAKAKSESETKASAISNKPGAKENETVAGSAGKRGAGGVRKDAKDREIEKLKEKLTEKALALKSEKENGAKLRKAHKDLQERRAEDADELAHTRALLDARDKENKAAAAQIESRTQREREKAVSVCFRALF